MKKKAKKVKKSNFEILSSKQLSKIKGGGNNGDHDDDLLES
jgi:bacteriocin-like protein